MKTIFPDYYKDFRCIAGECRHNCCIGWEIDIDEDTLEKYRAVSGEFGERLSKNISCDGVAHFVLSENERCPFLNSQNLCEVIINLGEDHLCQICDMHPRFRNELPDRVEIGLGISCEAAGKLILSKKEPVKFLPKFDTDDEIVILRDEIITILQKREFSIDERIDKMLELLEVSKPDVFEWLDLFSELEMLDEAWGKLLEKAKVSKPDFDGFATHVKGRETEYEQFLVYLIYRHFANAPDFDFAVSRGLFAVLSFELLYLLGAVTFAEKGEFTLDDQIELARLFSSEIEYSDQNLYTILDEI